MTSSGSPQIEVNTSDPTPPFEQVRKQVVGLIRSGQLVEGQRLPSVRQLAHDLSLAPGTVARAYSERDASGWVHSKRGAGTRVGKAPTETDSALALAEMTKTFLVEVKRAGFQKPAVIDTIDGLWD